MFVVEPSELLLLLLRGRKLLCCAADNRKVDGNCCEVGWTVQTIHMGKTFRIAKCLVVLIFLVEGFFRTETK